VLEAIGRQRAERLELADERKPRRDMASVARTPVFDGVREVRAPEHECRKRREELVVLPVVEFGEVVQAPDGA
jgi:hypothetical protein